MGCCSSTKRPRRQLGSIIQEKALGAETKEVVEVHDDVKLSKGEVRPAN